MFKEKEAKPLFIWGPFMALQLIRKLEIYWNSIIRKICELVTEVEAEEQS